MTKAERFHRSLRASASLLLAHGHRYPHHYPLSKLWMEAELAKERVNLQIASEATLMRTVIVSVLSTDNSGFENFKKQIGKLTR